MKNKEIEKRIDLLNNFDMKKKSIKIKDKSATIYFTSSLVDKMDIIYLMEYLDKLKSIKDLDLLIYNGEIKKETNIDTIIEELYAGFLVLYINDETIYLIDAKSYPNRSIEEPLTEKTIRGSRDGFSESINTNIGLIRRRLKTTDLVAKPFLVSEKSKTSVAVVYLKNEVDQRLIKRIEDELRNIDVESLIMSDRSLEELLFKQKYTPFPLVRYTERPDVASISIMHGKIAILVDTSASVIITPITLFDHTMHVEEFRQSPLVGTFTRLIRGIAILLSLFLIPLWMCIIDNSEIMNALKITISNENIELGIAIQIIIVELILEIVRLASIHTPTTLQTGISLISAVILGQVSLELGLFLPEVLLLCSISQICGFATPSYELSMSMKLNNLILILVVALFGKNGFIIYSLLLFLYLISLKVWSVPYLSPLCPFDSESIGNIFIRQSAENRKKL